MWIFFRHKYYDHNNQTFDVDRRIENSKELLNDARGWPHWSYIIRVRRSAYFCVFIDCTLTHPVRSNNIIRYPRRTTADKVNSRRNHGRKGPILSPPTTMQSEYIYLSAISLSLSLLLFRIILYLIANKRSVQLSATDSYRVVYAPNTAIPIYIYTPLMSWLSNCSVAVAGCAGWRDLGFPLKRRRKCGGSETRRVARGRGHIRHICMYVQLCVIRVVCDRFHPNRQ